jgi:hypothetical protein
MAEKPPAGPQRRQGPVDALPCPWCGRPNDMREGGQEGWGGEFKPDELGAGNVYSCDHCKRRFVLNSVQSLVWLVASPVR